MLIGISTGIKIYNLCFGLLIGLYEIYPDLNYKNQKILFKAIIKKGATMLCGCTIGFVIANPIFVCDRQAYYSNIELAKRNFEWSYVWELLTVKRLEWDLVNSGGLCHCIISLVGMIMLMIFSCALGESRRISCASTIVFVALIALFSINGRVLGWYYLPLIFIFPLCITEHNFYWLLLVVNFAFIKDDLCYQINTKFEQIENVYNEEEIENYAENFYGNYEGYEKIYFVDVGLKHIGTTWATWSEGWASLTTPEDSKKKFYIVISERYRALDVVDNLFLKANRSEDGYRLVDQKNGISILTYSNE